MVGLPSGILTLDVGATLAFWVGQSEAPSEEPPEVLTEDGALATGDKASIAGPSDSASINLMACCGVHLSCRLRGAGPSLTVEVSRAA